MKRPSETTETDQLNAVRLASECYELVFKLNADQQFSGWPCRMACEAAVAILGAVFSGMAQGVHDRVMETGEYDFESLRETVKEYGPTVGAKFLKL